MAGTYGLSKDANLASTRRGFIVGGLAVCAGALGASVARAAGPVLPALARLPDARALPIAGIRPDLLARARAALAANRHLVTQPELVGIADYSRQSAEPRFHLVDMVAGRATSFLVAHGRGSDPEHSGYVQYFSNEHGSLASSRGAYVTGERYSGKYGLSLRLEGLESSNSNALDRAIVVHGAAYVGEHMIREHGKQGRSEGCFAVPLADLYGVLARLTPGHMIYSDKV